MALKIWLDGKLVDQEDAKITVFDHGLLYGDGVFEGIRVYGGRIFRCAQHVRRLFDSARAIMLEIPMTPDQVTEAMYATLETNKLSEAYIRLIVTRGAGTLGLDPNECSDPQVIIITDSISLYPEEFYARGLAVVTVSVVRNLPHAVNPRIKSLNYLNNILAKIEALQAGADEAVMLNAQGYVTECAGDNIFVVRDGALTTPPASAGILEGVTRGAIMELARGAGMTALEQNITTFDLYAADECFLTGTAAELISVVKIDGRRIADGKPGPVTARLRELFREEIAKNAG
jgi:branched-chain amino acid aminotransferase